MSAFSEQDSRRAQFLGPKLIDLDRVAAVVRATTTTSKVLIEGHWVEVGTEYEILKRELLQMEEWSR